MKNRSNKTVFLLISFFVVVSLACGVFSQADPTATTQPFVQVEEPTQAEIIQEPAPTDTEVPLPTNTPEPIVQMPEEEPTEEPPPVEEPQVFFVEEFNSDPGWYFDVIKGRGGGDPNSVSYSFNFGRMIFDIPERHLYAYYMYEGAVYENVRLDINFENRGVNSQGVSLICHMSDEGWYELSIQSDGIWELYVYTDQYYRIARGGSTHIKMGKEINEYTFMCEGNKLSFFINGVQPTGSPHVDRKYALRWGEVGFGVASYAATPVKVEVDWFAVTPP